jgi:two-component system, response regulator YesN
MYKVLIVDDEPVIRFGLKASVDWEAEGLYLIGDYPNGEEALKAIESVQPDILITDIKMPLMDGITLMKHAIERYPHIKVILVSSYNDFEYVREGLRLGAVDYILKPTLEPEDFLQLLRNTIKKLHEEKNIESKLSQIEDSNLSEERRRIENEIKRVILSEEKQLIIENFPQWLQNDFIFVYMEMNQVVRVEMEHDLLYKTYILDEIQTLFYRKIRNGISFSIGDTKMLFLIEKYKQEFEIVESLKKLIEDETNFRFAFSYLTVSNITLIGKSFLQLQQAINKKSLSTDNEIIDKALDFIHQHYTEEMTLRRIGEYVHISRNYFSIIFKRHLDKNFIDYVIELRVNKAKELLAQTSLKIYEVAEKSGFRDVKYFSKAFKRLTGLSPVDYRSQNQE